MLPRTCPNCRKEIPLNEGFHFDEQLNLICDYCGKTAFLVEREVPVHIPYRHTILPILPADQPLNLDKL